MVTDFGGVGVVVDRMSAPYLAGASIDFVDTIEKQGFTIDNPTRAGPAPAATRSMDVPAHTASCTRRHPIWVPPVVFRRSFSGRSPCRGSGFRASVVVDHGPVA